MLSLVVVDVLVDWHVDGVGLGDGDLDLLLHLDGVGLLDLIGDGLLYGVRHWLLHDLGDNLENKTKISTLLKGK